MPAADTLIADDVDLLADAARRAGAVALSFFKNDPKVWIKGQNSPVSEADIAVNDYLEERLRTARPDHGWLSEETEDDGDRLTKTDLFIVDPIDGTRAFIDGGRDWTISIAIVRGHRPVAAALYAPVRDELFLAGKGDGATINGCVACPSQRRKLNGAHVAGPNPILKHGAVKRAGIQSAGFIASLAYRLALVGIGRIDGGVARPHAHDWDLAAADLIVEEAGARLTDVRGRPIRYNMKNLRHPALLAAPAGLHGELRRLVVKAT